MPLALVFILFPAVAQLAAVLGGERGMDAPSLVLLALVLGLASTALTGGRRPAGLRLPPALGRALAHGAGQGR